MRGCVVWPCLGRGQPTRRSARAALRPPLCRYANAAPVTHTHTHTLALAGTVQAMRIKSDPGATGVLTDVLYSGT